MTRTRNYNVKSHPGLSMGSERRQEGVVDQLALDRVLGLRTSPPNIDGDYKLFDTSLFIRHSALPMKHVAEHGTAESSRSCGPCRVVRLRVGPYSTRVERAARLYGYETLPFDRTAAVMASFTETMCYVPPKC